MNTTPPTPPIPPAGSVPPGSDGAQPPRDELDSLLREWHETNRASASQGRDRLMAALKQEDAMSSSSRVHLRITTDEESDAVGVSGTGCAEEPHIQWHGEEPESQWHGVVAVIRRIVVNKYSPLAAAAIALAALLPFMMKPTVSKVIGQPVALREVMVPEGGLLEALDKDGNSLGPCALAHTDVHAEISGRFSRVTVKQQYQNKLSEKIEAVYTFPLSHRAGVDRMTMTIGDRVITGEVKERQEARRIYEAAKAADRVASLLEQERPNIFTQSVANIEPGATIDIEISYVEIVKETDGQFAFEFPTVVGPRYIPGAPLNGSTGKERLPPEGFRRRGGLVLLGPAGISDVQAVAAPTPPEADAQPVFQAGASTLLKAIEKATPVEAPADTVQLSAACTAQAHYSDGSAEQVTLYQNGVGQVGSRWFASSDPAVRAVSSTTAAGEEARKAEDKTVAGREPANMAKDERPAAAATAPAPDSGKPFGQPTTQVPDADRITPTPTRPPMRSGHDISISVTLDTGGPGLTSLDSALHKVKRTDLGTRDDGLPRRVSITLENQSEIPNRDFVLNWKQTSDTITDAVFTNTGPHGNFFCIQLDPPKRVDDAQAVPRELVFVLDTSGSMNGLPIAKSREVMQKAIDALRPQDTFNIITFAGDTKILWPEPRPSTGENRRIAQEFISTLRGGGGTEMMKAINAALEQKPERPGAIDVLLPAQLADQPADGRQVTVRIEDHQLSCPRRIGGTPGRAEGCGIAVRSDLVLPCTEFSLPHGYGERVSTRQTTGAVVLNLRGRWLTRDGTRIFDVAAATYAGPRPVRPLRLAVFLTDAYVGNDMAIIDAVRKNRATTRVFAFGIGNSVNRYLLDGMAAAGGGEVEYVLIDSQDQDSAAANASAAVERFNRRTQTPVLTDIRVTFSDGMKPLDMLPDPANGIPDLFDAKPVTIIGRYAGPGAGTIMITGQTGQGAWEKSVLATFPAMDERNTSLPTIWARAKIETLMNSDLAGIQQQRVDPEVRRQIVNIGETFGVMSQFTSLVAVDKLRVTVAGRPMLVNVPIELPDATSWEGFFDDAVGNEGEAEKDAPRDTRLMLRASALDEVVKLNRERGRMETGKNEVMPAMIYNGNAGAPVTVSPGAPAATTGAPISGGSGGRSAGGSGPAAPAGGIAPSSAPEPRAAAPAANVRPADPSPSEKKPAGAPASHATSAPSIGKPSGDRGESKKDAVDEVARRKHMSSRASRGEEMGRKAGESGADKLGASIAIRGNTLTTSNIAAEHLATVGGKLQFGYSLHLGDDDLMEGAAGEIPAPQLNVLAATQLAQNQRVSDACSLVCDTPNDTNYQPWSTLCDVLKDVKDEKQLPPDRTQKVQEIQQRVQADVQAQRRTLRLRRVLDDALFAAVTGIESKVETSKVADTAAARAPAGGGALPNPVLVTILLADVDAATLEKVKALGVSVETVNEPTKLAIARVPVEKLAELAMLGAVRRVEVLGEGK